MKTSRVGHWMLRVCGVVGGLTLLCSCAGLTPGHSVKKCVVVWSEGTAPKDVYPNDINGAVAEGLAGLKGWEVVTANLDDPDQGLPDELLQRADVLVWWGHQRHGEVKDSLVDRIEKRVKEDGMGFIALHSSHFAKPNKRLMGTPCSFKAYVGDSTTLQVTVADPKHPIAKGVSPDFTLVHHERYSDPYAVPEPDAIVFDGVASLKNGGKDPSHQGYCWTVGKGRMFYFQVGHETNPVYYDDNIRKIMANAVTWAAPQADLHLMVLPVQGRMDVSPAYKSHTLATLIQGMATMGVVILLSLIHFAVMAESRP